ncbi:unnamed protein product [Adineta steineri]|uniref:G-protein coupled receptors family 1 profile domain-containing protein n=1 Tax=Adineta steineri TaxID=433720 RepID=A0A818TTX8_9BILA|nr:unnamed protein product [Adineta steineri]CAF3686930.1 unnamed protein product [Adineta steineri]
MSLSTVLYSIQQNVLKFGGPIVLSIGTIGCILNLMVFTKNSLRKNPCTICLIAVNIVDIIYFYLGFLLTILAVGYNTDLSISSIGFCRFRFYISFVLTCSQPTCLILASIDRTLITSKNVETRQRSTRRLIITSLISLILFYAIVEIHGLLFMEILQYGPNYFVCFYQPGTYTTFMGYHALIVNGFIPPLLMAIFGLWTVKNVRNVQRRLPITHATNREHVNIGRSYVIQSKDRQLIRMLLVDIIAFIIFKFPVTIILIYQQITQYNQKSSEQQIIEQSFLQLSYFWYFIDSSISCYTNILVSKTFRTELKNILSNISLFFCRRP